LAIVVTVFLSAVFTEMFADDFAATALPCDVTLLVCFDFEAFDAVAFGLLRVGGLALPDLAASGCPFRKFDPASIRVVR
jgi:hypothetical protein